MTNNILIINGNAINDISSFYNEVNRVFMGGMDWKLGPSLDALDDMLYGGYGAINGNENIIIKWLHIDHCRKVLGFDATMQFYTAKLNQPEIYNITRIKNDIANLQKNGGPTYFEIILQIFADHGNIQLIHE